MAIKLAASNLGWAAADDERVYARLQQLGYTGLEIAPTRIFPERPYDCLPGAVLFAGYLYQKYGLTIPSMQSIWYGHNGSIYDPAQAQALADYTDEAFTFARTVHCPNLVFGCPRQRAIPEGETRQTADEFINEIGQRAGLQGVYLALEANPTIYNTNYLNTHDQVFALVEQLGLPGLTVNLDLGAMLYNGEQLRGFVDKIKFVSHIHISEPGLVPIEKRPLHEELAGLLHAVGYKGYVSVEMKTADYDTVDRALTYVAEVFG